MQVEKHAMMDRFQTHLAKMGVECVALQPRSIDIDHEFRQNTRGYPGIMNIGTFRIFSRNINYINLLTKVGTDAASYYSGYMESVHYSELWQVRYFLQTERYFLQTDRQGKLAPFEVHTEAKVDKGFMHSKMVDVTWKGNGKMTMLPPSVQDDDILGRLSGFRDVLLHHLAKEKVIRIQGYTPKKKLSDDWTDYVVMSGEWRDGKNIFVAKDCFEMYDKIAHAVKGMIQELKYW